MVSAYNSLSSACTNGVLAVGARQLLETMQSQELTPNVIAYNSVISACANGGQAVAAVQFWSAVPSRPRQSWQPGNPYPMINPAGAGAKFSHLQGTLSGRRGYDSARLSGNRPPATAGHRSVRPQHSAGHRSVRP